MTAQYLVYVFLAVSALPLVVAFFFAPQVTGSAGVQRFAAAINAGARALLKRRYTALALLGMLLPTIAHAQPEHAAGEANLILPDLLTVHHFGLDGRALLMIGLLFCVGGLLFGLAIFVQLKNLPVHRSMREMSELIYETCKTYLITQGKFILLLWVFIAVIISLYFGWLAPVRKTDRGYPAHHPAVFSWSASRAATAWRGSAFASTPLPTPAWHSPD